MKHYKQSELKNFLLSSPHISPHYCLVLSNSSTYGEDDLITEQKAKELCWVAVRDKENGGILFEGFLEKEPTEYYKLEVEEADEPQVVEVVIQVYNVRGEEEMYLKQYTLLSFPVIESNYESYRRSRPDSYVTFKWADEAGKYSMSSIPYNMSTDLEAVERGDMKREAFDSRWWDAPVEEDYA